MGNFFTRRDFLKLGGLAGAAVTLGPRLLLSPAAAAEKRSPVLVHIFLRGGMDGLSAVVPWGEKAYYDLRKATALSAPKRGDPSAVADLDGRFGLHPALSPLLPHWQAKRLAIVHATGSPHPTRSHFDAQDFMESGTPGVKTTRGGWVNRFLMANSGGKGDPFRAVAVTPTLPRTLVGDAPVLAIADFRTFRLGSAGTLSNAISDMYRRGEKDVVHDSGREALRAIERLEKIDPTRFLPENGALYPGGRLGRELLMIAQRVKSNIGLEAAFAEGGGWDTHLDQGAAEGAFANRLTELGAALHAFATDLGDRLRDVVVVTLTEFGRTARENGTRGTDHGHGSVSFVLGGQVSGGSVFGKWPGLDPENLWQKRDLAVTTDFRDVLAEVLIRHQKARGLEKIFPGHRPTPVDLFA